MPTLRVLDRSGDHRVSWSAERLQRGDLEARLAVQEAERIFAQERARGSSAFRLDVDGRAVRVEVLDPLAEETILVPQISGG
jgi:hypothetical protein